jgi:uncharacterized membrane protein YhaH (DUF805 family)
MPSEPAAEVHVRRETTVTRRRLRSGRLEFLAGELGTIAGLLLATNFVQPSAAATSWAGWAFFVAWVLGPGLWIVRRLADIDRDNGAGIWMAFIPVLNLLFLMYLCLMPGTAGHNYYGPPAPQTRLKKRVLLGIILLSIAYLMVAAASSTE